MKENFLLKYIWKTAGKSVQELFKNSFNIKLLYFLICANLLKKSEIEDVEMDELKVPESFTWTHSIFNDSP